MKFITFPNAMASQPIHIPIRQCVNDLLTYGIPDGFGKRLDGPRAAEMMGRLVQVLADSGMLADDDVFYVLGMEPNEEGTRIVDREI